MGTAPLAGIGKVTGAGRIAAVVIGGLVALGSILWTIRQASRVLTPEYTTFQELEGLAPLRQLVEEEEPDAFLGRWGQTLAEFKARRDDEWAALYSLLELQPTADTDRQTLETALVDQQREIAELEAYARQLLATGTYFEVLERFKQARTHMLYGALVAAVGVVVFAWGLNAEQEDKEDTTAAEAVPRLATLTLTEEGKQALGTQLGTGCDTKKITVAVVEGTTPPYTVVALPKDGCNPVQFILQANMGTFTEPVKTVTTAAPSTSPPR